MNFSWPGDAPNIPDAPWVHSVLEQLAEKYDTVEEHGWYDNLNPTVDQILADAHEDYLLLDYSGGTGILADRILRRAPNARNHSRDSCILRGRSGTGARGRRGLRWTSGAAPPSTAQAREER